MENDTLYAFFNEQFPFNKDGLNLFVQSFEVKVFKKNTLLLQENQIEKELRFLDEGIVRDFYAKEDKEKNADFYFGPEFVTDFYSFISDKPTKKNKSCLTEVKLRVMSKKKFLAFLEEYECGKSFVDELFRRIIAQKEKEEFKWFLNTAEENYLELLTHKPQWVMHIPQYHIASYLGIKPETLSRIRKKVKI